MCPKCQGGDLIGEDECTGCDGSGWILRGDDAEEIEADVWCPLSSRDIADIEAERKISHDARCGHVERGDIVRFFDVDHPDVHVNVRNIAVGVPHMASLVCGPTTKVVF